MNSRQGLIIILLLIGFYDSLYSYTLRFVDNTCIDNNIGNNLDYIILEPFNNKTNPNWSEILTDIIQHTPPNDTNPYNDLVTLAHETTHGINSYIRNKLNNTWLKANGFYILNNRAIIIVEPNILKSKVKNFVPLKLRGLRYKLYVEGSSAWDDRPLYLWDEWVAYLNGSKTAVELYETWLWKYGRRDAMAGTIEFVVYGIAVAMAVQAYDQNYFVSNLQFKEFLKWLLQESMHVFIKGKDIDVFNFEYQQTYYNDFINNPSCESIREFLRDTFGVQWVYQVFGF